MRLATTALTLAFLFALPAAADHQRHRSRDRDHSHERQRSVAHVSPSVRHLANELEDTTRELYEDGRRHTRGPAKKERKALATLREFLSRADDFHTTVKARRVDPQRVGKEYVKLRKSFGKVEKGSRYLPASGRDLDRVENLLGRIGRSLPHGYAGHIHDDNCGGGYAARDDGPRPGPWRGPRLAARR